MRSLMVGLLAVSTLSSCEMVTDSEQNKPVSSLVNAQRTMDWFVSTSVEQVIEAHEAQQIFGLIALNRRGYFYPKVGMARGPLNLKTGCQTWLIAASNDVLNNDSEREQAAALQAFAAKFNMHMESKCLP
ncbi:hypothetical protein HG263_05630 [Pseudoalteromonas sp. JBTF-M23]|uniref:Uncharacterized protein n=1 Tax=Pseudoalteromonas caenipelagi TaxID=2726988 RepID=A0A849VE61_9GAMM|nr:hypothetical protein [Pseudoalteromonas caenipelagi]NOU50017.1 hypothetical protein [Pseudoalteromonas caenipelagi]